MAYRNFILFYFSLILTCQVYGNHPIEFKDYMYNVSTAPSLRLKMVDYGELTFLQMQQKEVSASMIPIQNYPIYSKYVQGQYDNWMNFEIHNNYDLEKPIIIKFRNERDSLWIISKGEIIEKTYFVSCYNKDKTGFIKMQVENGSTHIIPPHQTVEVWIKSHRLSFSKETITPYISDSRTFESNYLSQNRFSIFLFLIFGIVTFLAFVLSLIYGIYMNSKLFLNYAAFIFLVFIISWRNLENILPYFVTTFNIVSYMQGMVLQTCLTYLFYIHFVLGFVELGNIDRKKFIFSVVLSITFVLILDTVFTYNYDNDYYRNLLYHTSRRAYTISFLYLIVKVWHINKDIARLVLLGTLITLVFESISWFFTGFMNDLISIIGITSQLIIFLIAIIQKSKEYMNENKTLQLDLANAKLENAYITNNIKTNLAHDLHDEMGLGLTSINFLVHDLQEEIGLKSKHSNQKLENIKQIGDSLLDNMREIIWSMNPQKDIVTEFMHDVRKIFFNSIIHSNLKGNFDFHYIDELI